MDSGWIKGARPFPSPNFDQRPQGIAIDLLVIHYISLPPGRFSGSAVQEFFLNRLDHEAHPFFRELRDVKVSAHFFVRRDGSLLQFVSTDQRAWHAGQSFFDGRERCNDFSIGIELEGDDQHAFTIRQYQRLTRLTKHLAARYPLRAVVGHSHIAPGRKEDPGPFFDWGLYRNSLLQLSSAKFSKIFFSDQFKQGERKLS